MKSTKPVRYLHVDQSPASPDHPRTPAGVQELKARVRQAIVCSRQLLLSSQRIDGSWIGQQRGNVSLESLLVFRSILTETQDSASLQDLAKSILKRQLPTGGWSLTDLGPLDLSLSVQAYLALKLAGTDPASAPMRIARTAILAAGGADQCDVGTRILLALFGQIPYDSVPCLLPELAILPKWVRKQVFAAADVPAETNLPLSVLWSHRVSHEVECSRGTRELFQSHPRIWSEDKNRGLVEATLNTAFHWLEHGGWVPFRCRALNRLEKQLGEQAVDVHTASLYQAIWTDIALYSLGFAAESAERSACGNRIAQLTSGFFEEGTPLSPLTSPVRDTARAVGALAESGVSPDETELVTDWFPARTYDEPSCPVELAEQLNSLDARKQGKDPAGLPPELSVSCESSWGYDEFCREWKSPREEVPVCGSATPIADFVRALLNMQRADGGWSSTTESCPAITGLVLEALACATDESNSVFSKAVAFLTKSQQANGSWQGNRGGSSVHATSCAVRGLLAAGAGADHSAVEAGVEWLLVEQQTDGAWCDTPGGNGRAVGSPTQTAWALRALFAAGRSDSPAVNRGVEFLVQTQNAVGGWDEPSLPLRLDNFNRPTGNQLVTDCEALVALCKWAVNSESAGDSPTEWVPRLVTEDSVPVVESPPIAR